jgi:hypothetical protein
VASIFNEFAQADEWGVLLVPITLTADARPGVRIFIEASPPRGEEVMVELEARGLRASVLQRVGGVEGELKRFVARYVSRELDKPHVLAARTIDVSRAIDRAWAAISPRPRDDGRTADLDDEREREIEHDEGPDGGDREGR